MMFRDFFREKYGNRSIVVAGFGREGRSSYQTLRKHLPGAFIKIVDTDNRVKAYFNDAYAPDDKVAFYTGANAYGGIGKGDVVFKSPGIPTRKLLEGILASDVEIVSQTAVFLHLFKKQVIGITGTKGKSTTASLLHQIFSEAGYPILLGGNIGIPPFDLIEQMDDDTHVVFEMSSHQLENITTSPAIAILLNVFQEHLDHYDSYRDYQLAKINIARWQQPGDLLIYNAGNSIVKQLVDELDLRGEPFALHGLSKSGYGVECHGEDLHITRNHREMILEKMCSENHLRGAHNLTNIMAAALAGWLSGVDVTTLRRAISRFRGLAHRLEYVGEYGGVKYYNDSISTIPESTIEAVRSFTNVGSLLLGGFDRGVDYGLLVDFLLQKNLPHLVFTGKAGERMLMELKKKAVQLKSKTWMYADFQQAVESAARLTAPGQVCLLSPAAASYDMFKNFEERGEKFRQIVHHLFA